MRASGDPSEAPVPEWADPAAEDGSMGGGSHGRPSSAIPTTCRSSLAQSGNWAATPSASRAQGFARA
eukprot:11220992-Lingulodinium_polyedra.AAC.1